MEIRELIERYSEMLNAARREDILESLDAEKKSASDKKLHTKVAIARVAKLIDGLKYIETEEPITRSDKVTIVEGIAESLGIGDSPEFTKRFNKYASVDQQLIVINDILDAGKGKKS